MKIQLALVAALVVLLLATMWRPLYPREQWLQHVPTVLAIPALAWGAHKRLLTTGAFACLAVVLALHILGARWIYSFVPYDEWSTALFGASPREAFGWTRNHYDRFVHFAFGLLMPLPLAETAMRYGNLCRRWALAWALAAVAAISALYEVFEWLLAVIAAPEMADAYNGQQGDGWDAQKDMALALLGGVVALAWLAVSGAGTGASRPSASRASAAEDGSVATVPTHNSRRSD
jgi:putative membrane protein